MAKFNLSVAVMVDDEPIMYLCSRNYERKSMSTHFVQLELKKLLPALDFYLIKGKDSGVDYCEYASVPDLEANEAQGCEVLAIFQEIK